MNSNNLKSFITTHQCCSAIKAIKGYKQVSLGGKDPFCDSIYTILSAAYLEILSCEALKKYCKSEDFTIDDCDLSTLEGDWVVNTVCVEDDCSTEYAAEEFVAMIDSVWSFSENQSESTNYDGEIEITSPHSVDSQTISWYTTTDGEVTSDFSFEPPNPYVGKIYMEMINCNNIIITFEQALAQVVTVYLSKATNDFSNMDNENESNCENYCLTDNQICDIVYWFKRYCSDCSDDFEPKGLTK